MQLRATAEDALPNVVKGRPLPNVHCKCICTFIIYLLLILMPANCNYGRIIQTEQINSTHPADDLEEALWQFIWLSLQQRNIWIHSKQPQLLVFLHAVKSWVINEKLAINRNRCWITEFKFYTAATPDNRFDCVVGSPSDSSLRKLFGMSGCIMSPPTENTVFMVSMNHSLSGAYVWTFIGKKIRQRLDFCFSIQK